LGTNIGKTTKNLWEKKYGNDVTRTLLNEEEKQDNK
jgi:hypothetical protein